MIGPWLGNLGNKVLKNIAISLARDNLPALVSNWNSYSINSFFKKNSEIGAVGKRKGFILLQIYILLFYLLQMKILMILLKP